MLFKNDFIRYLFILLLSVHLTVSQYTDSTEGTPTASAKQTSTNEQSTDTESKPASTLDVPVNTDSSLSTENIELSTSSIFITDPSDATLPSSDPPTTTEDQSLSSSSSEIPSSSPTTSEGSSTSEQALSDTSEITSLSTDEVFSGTSTIDTATNNSITISELTASSEIRDSSTMDPATANSPSDESTSEMSSDTTEISGPITSSTPTLTSLTEISGTTETYVLMTEAAQESTSDFSSLTEINSPNTVTTFSSPADTATAESIILSSASIITPEMFSSTAVSPDSMPSDETIASTTIYTSPLSYESTLSFSIISGTESPTNSDNTEPSISSSPSSMESAPTGITLSTDIDSTTIPVPVSVSTVEPISTSSGDIIDFSEPSTQITGFTQIPSDITGDTTKPPSVPPFSSDTNPSIITGEPSTTPVSDISSVRTTSNINPTLFSFETGSPSKQTTGLVESVPTQESVSSPSSIFTPSGSSQISTGTAVATTPVSILSVSTNTNSINSSSTISSILPTSFQSSTTTTTATTTNATAVILVQPLTAGYTITLAFSESRFNANTEEGRKALLQSLKDSLPPYLFDVAINDVSCSNGTCTVSSSTAYRGFGNPDPKEIEEYIRNRPSGDFSSPTVLRTNDGSCPYKQQDSCYYCGSGSPCARLPESKCVLPDDTSLTYFCKCDRSRYFFRTNYEYDETCSRISFLWWPQMLAICLLVFLILILIALAALLFYRRRRRTTLKKPKREPAVIGNEPQKTSDFEYVELNNLNQLSNENTSAYQNIRQSRPIYSVDRSNDYVYRRRAPQNYTYPARTYPYVQRGLPPAYYTETNDRLDILNDFFPTDQAANQRFDVIHNTDDEIYV